MTESYYCGKCKGFVIPVKGGVIHPHLGQTPALVCPKCGGSVYLRKELQDA